MIRRPQSATLFPYTTLFRSNAYGTVTSSNAVLTVNPPPPCTPLPPGLVGWWRGEGNCLDQAGGNNGVLQNGASFASGEIGQAFTFDGVNDYVKIPRTPILDVGYQVTIDLWMKADLSSPIDRKSTRLNSSHLGISYAVFCLEKKN